MSVKIESFQKRKDKLFLKIGSRRMQGVYNNRFSIIDRHRKWVIIFSNPLNYEFKNGQKPWYFKMWIWDSYESKILKEEILKWGNDILFEDMNNFFLCRDLMKEAGGVLFITTKRSSNKIFSYVLDGRDRQEIYEKPFNNYSLKQKSLYVKCFESNNPNSFIITYLDFQGTDFGLVFDDYNTYSKGLGIEYTYHFFHLMNEKTEIIYNYPFLVLKFIDDYYDSYDSYENDYVVVFFKYRKGNFYRDKYYKFFSIETPLIEFVNLSENELSFSILAGDLKIEDNIMNY